MNIEKVIIFIILGILTYKQFVVGENMSNEDINKQINEIYKADIGAIRNLSKLANDLTKQGSLSVKGGLKLEGPFNLLPKGCIIAWNGKTAPAGWAMCNGKNGTPDLRGRFIYGYGSGLGKTFNKRGGSETHKLSINEIPSHNHSMKDAGNHHHYMGGPNGSAGGRKNAWVDFGGWHHGRNVGNRNTHNAGNHKHHINNTGGSKSHNNMPPYHVLSYIMKL